MVWFFLVRVLRLGLNNLMVSCVLIFDNNLLIFVVIGWEKLKSKSGCCFIFFFINVCSL